MKLEKKYRKNPKEKKIDVQYTVFINNIHV